MRSIELIELLKLRTDLTDLLTVFIYGLTATIRKLFLARTTSAESSALVVRNCHAAQPDRVYGPRSCNSNSSLSRILYS